jgi:hypothetical protein
MVEQFTIGWDIHIIWSVIGWFILSIKLAFP